MKTQDTAESNVAKIATLFPQCVTERIGKSGTAELAIDFDKLRDELSKYNTTGKSDRFGTQDKTNKNVIRTWATTQEKSIQRSSRPK